MQKNHTKLLSQNEREIILRILAIEREEKRRQNFNKIDRYNVGDKVHVKQLAFHKCLKRNRWVFGGNRSGKTECGAVEAVWLARGIHPYRPNREKVDGWVVSLTQEVQRDVAQKKVLSYLKPDWIERITMQEGSKDFPEGGIIDTVYVKNVFGKTSSIGFKCISQGREKFQGASLDFVWFDEEPTEEIYLECLLRVLDKVGDIFGTMTPLKGLTWVYDSIYLNAMDDPEIWWEQMEWKDNPYLNEEEIKRFSTMLSEEELENRKYGHFSGSSGLVYPEFDSSVHVIEPFPLPLEWQGTVSIDPGLNNPLSAHFYCVDYDGNIYVVAEHYEAKRDIAYHASRILEIAKGLNWHFRSDGKLEALIDSAANQRTLASPKNVSELFYEHGIAVNTNVNKDIFTGVSKVRAVFSARPPKIFIFNTCKNMIREIKGYFWGSGDLPVKRNDHAMDELRYFVMAHLKNVEPKPPKNKLQQHKENAVKKIKYTN